MNNRRILGLSFLCAVFLYGAVAHFVVRGAEAVPIAQFLVAAFYVSALGTLVAGMVVIPRMSLSGGAVVAMALCEVPAIFGLVLAVLSKSPRDFYVLGGSSFLSLLYLTLKKNG